MKTNRKKQHEIKNQLHTRVVEDKTKYSREENKRILDEEIQYINPDNKRFKLKEQLYLKAIENLNKKINFLHLYINVLAGDITEKEYEKEINNNSDKYCVDLDKNYGNEEINTITEIVDKLPNKNELFVDDISDMFGYDLDCNEFL